MASSQGEKEEGERETMSPEEIGRYRGIAQQESIDAIRSAEERYNKAKESGSAALKGTKETVTHGVGAATAYVAGKGIEAKDYAKKAAEKTKDVTLGTGKAAVDYAKQAAGKAKEVTVGGGQSTQGKQYGGNDTSTKEEVLQDVSVNEEEEYEQDDTETNLSPISSIVGNILDAVGESIIVIARTTKEIVLGRDPRRRE